MLHIALVPPLPAPIPAETTPLRSSLIVRLASLFLAWRRRQATIATLHGLDSRTLKDIGLYRGEIESAVNTGGAERRLRFADGTGRLPPI